MFAGYLKQSTPITVPVGPFVDATDGFTLETALTLLQADFRLSKNGGSFSLKTEVTTATHMENGWYALLLDATDTNTLGRLTIGIVDTGARQVWREYMVVSANIWDSLFGADKLQVDVAEWLGAAPATPTVAGVPEVDQTHLLGAAVATPTVAGVPEVDATHWRGEAIPATSATGVPKVDQSHLLGTAVATPTVAGVPEVDVSHWNGAAVAVPTVAGVPEVDLTHLGGAVQSATDLKDFADEGYDPSTNLVASTATIGGLSAQAKADINAEMLDVLNVDTFAQPGQGAPGATTTMRLMLAYLYKWARNKRELTATQESFYNDDASTIDQKRTVADDATTSTKGEIATGP